MNPILKTFYLLVAWISLVLGVIGIFIPLLPTTPFMILSAFLFSKSSPRFHHWLLSNRFTGKMIRDWREHRLISLRAKILCFLMVSTSLFFLNSMPSIPIIIKSLVSLSLISVLGFVLTRKSQIGVLCIL